MKFRDLWTEAPDGRASVPRTWTNVGCAVASIGFLSAIKLREISLDLFVGYALAVAIITTPTLAAKVIGLRMGAAVTPPKPTTPPPPAAPAGAITP